MFMLNGTIYLEELEISLKKLVPLVISLDIKSDPVTNEHAMHFGVNLLTEIFRDTHTLPTSDKQFLLP